MPPKFAKPKNYCKYWKSCADFRRSQCEETEMFIEGCRKYQEYKEKEKNAERERKTKKQKKL
jgi:hypothetical protein